MDAKEWTTLRTHREDKTLVESDAELRTEMVSDGEGNRSLSEYRTSDEVGEYDEGSWDVEGGKAFRCFRIRQTGPNAFRPTRVMSTAHNERRPDDVSGHPSYTPLALACGGIELYGTLVPLPEAEPEAEQQ